MNPVHLLLVEDDAVSRGFLTLALQSMPATVVDVASNGAQARDAVQTATHALWLLDANLPDARGEDLLAELRAVRPGVPALCLTAEAAPERWQSLHAAGFTHVTQKPLTIAELHAVVRRALARPATAAAAATWDDAAALSALGGNAAALAAMRGLFRAELPVQSTRIIDALGAGRIDEALAGLHMLKASCGFVGCLPLLAAIRALATAPTDAEALQQFRIQVAAAQVPAPA